MKNPLSLLAPNPTPFGDVILDDDDIKENGKKQILERDDVFPLSDLIFKLQLLSTRAGSADCDGLINGINEFIALIKRRQVERNFPDVGNSWIFAGEKTINWLRAGAPAESDTKSFKVLNKLNRWSVFARGNSKLPYLAFSTLPGVTCPGAGECLTAIGSAPSKTRRLIPDQGKGGGWCYSFKAWRYANAFFRQLGNTLLLRYPGGRDYIARCFDLWAESEARVKGGETVRLYVDGDIDTVKTLKFWMDACARHPHVRAYGYSKSWQVFLEYERLGYKWPSNYVLNLSDGSKFYAIPSMREKMMKLPITREDFAVVNLPSEGRLQEAYPDVKALEDYDGLEALLKRLKWKDTVAELWASNPLIPIKIKQNIINLDPKYDGGVFGAIGRLERRILATPATEEAEIVKLTLLLHEWKQTAAKLVSNKKLLAKLEADNGADNEEEKKVISVPDEFWSRNPKYTKAVSIQAIKVYGKGNYFVCPGKCGNCLGHGKHACGEIRLKVPVVIGIH